MLHFLVCISYLCLLSKVTLSDSLKGSVEYLNSLGLPHDSIPRVVRE